jgi:DNA-binding beta-propeller fold protein YncE
MSYVFKAGLAATALAGSIVFANAAQAQNSAPNPFRMVEGVWAPLPNGRAWGSTSSVAASADRETIWAVDRCGDNSCAADYTEDVVFEFNKDGEILRQWGAGMFVRPHGMHVDREGNVWVADDQIAEGRGGQVIKFSPDGEVLLRLGQAGVEGNDQNTFSAPTHVLVAPDGNIFVSDGHGAGDNNRIVKFAPDGTYILEWGEPGTAPGQFTTPHALAMDSEGLLYVADRGNARVQVFDQEGVFVRQYLNLGRVSGLDIDDQDRLYAADSESSLTRNPGFKRGIRIMDIATAEIIAFIPDPNPNATGATSSSEGVAVDNDGNVYGAEVESQDVKKFVLPGGRIR